MDELEAMGLINEFEWAVRITQSGMEPETSQIEEDNNLRRKQRLAAAREELLRALTNL